MAKRRNMMAKKIRKRVKPSSNIYCLGRNSSFEEIGEKET
jgi:hypothetical protein